MKNPTLIWAGMTLALLFSITDTRAQEADVCVETCREAARDCALDAREATATCSTDAGCDELRDDYRAVCFGAVEGSESCSAAREAFRGCIEPCREVAREVHETCRDEMRTCLEQDCGVQPRINQRSSRKRGEQPPMD